MAETEVVGKKIWRKPWRWWWIHCIDFSRISALSPFQNYEDEDFAIEVTIPRTLSEDDVLDRCHRECLRAEDEFDVFILPKVVVESG